MYVPVVDGVGTSERKRKETRNRGTRLVVDTVPRKAQRQPSTLTDKIVY